MRTLQISKRTEEQGLSKKVPAADLWLVSTSFL